MSSQREMSDDVRDVRGKGGLGKPLVNNGQGSIKGMGRLAGERSTLGGLATLECEPRRRWSDASYEGPLGTWVLGSWSGLVWVWV